MSNVQRIIERITIYRNNIAEKDSSQFLFAIRELTSREIKRKYARSHLGIIWSVLQPLLHMVVMTLIFSYMFKRSIQNFPLYYLTGQIFWSLFSTSTNASISSLVDNRNFLLKTKLPIQTFVLSRVFTALVNFGYTMIAYVGILFFNHIFPTWSLFFFFFDVILVLMFSVGISYILSIVYVYFADINHLYGVLLTIWMYLSAIFYPVESLPIYMKQIVNYNPIYLAIYIARESVVYGRVPDIIVWVKLAIFSIVTLFVGYRIFKKNQNKVSSLI